jgi:hypothetical protein
MRIVFFRQRLTKKRGKTILTSAEILPSFGETMWTASSLFHFAVFDGTESWYLEGNAMNRRKYALGLRINDSALRGKANCLPLRGINSELSRAILDRFERKIWL